MSETQVVNKMFNELTVSIESIKKLYSMGMYSSIECFNNIGKYLDKFTETLNNLLFFNVICKETYDYGYSLIEKIDCLLW